MHRLLIAAVLLVVASPAPADAWGFDVHRYIMERAIPLLPAEIRPFFEKFRTAIAEHSIDPDLWRTAGWEQEPPRHFMDMDAYGPPPFSQVPRAYDEAVRRYGREFVDKNGTVPWRTEEIFRKLSEAFTQKAPYARENIKFFSSVVGHYVADACVPFHAALNYDGQLTGQWGIHSRFETELFARYRDRLRVTPAAPSPVANASDFVFDALISGFALVQPILEADKAAVAGREEYDDEYFARFFAKVQPALERRLEESISRVASLIASAWVAAGRPALPVEERRVPRKVRRGQ